MIKQTILVSDEFGNHTGEYIDRDLAHTGRGKRHLAITVLLKNSRGQVLLQHRKHKIHSDIWDFAGSTHHLHKNNGKDETTEEATYRCLKDEYGIAVKIPLKVLGGVNYFAKDGKNCENEHDLIVIGEYDGVIKPKETVAYDFKWVDKKKFLADISKNPKKFAPWVVAANNKLSIFDDQFKKLLSDFLRDFEPFVSGYFKNRAKTLSKYPPLIRKFYSDLEDVSSGGKRMRAFLVYLGYLVAGGVNLKRMLPIALAMEVIHTYLLVHDDIIDKSDTRRGKATIHKRYEKSFGSHYGISQAIVLGDIAVIEALKLIDSSQFGADTKTKLKETISGVILETLYGEALDIEYSYKDAKMSEILEVCDLKTARYSFVGPLTVGGILAGAGSKQKDAMREFGLKIGLAFQLVDDLLGVFGDEKTLGKSTLSDMREGKNTLLIYKAKSLAKRDDVRTLDKLWGKQDANKKDLEAVKKIIKESGAYDWSVQEMNNFRDRAVDWIGKVTGDRELRQVFSQMSDFIVTRRS